MCLLWEIPLQPEVRPKADENDPLATLRNSKIGGIQYPPHQAILGFNLALRGMMLLKSREVVNPTLIVALGNSRMLQLKFDVRKVRSEGRACQALHILEYERLRPCFSDDTYGLRPHVAIIRVRS